MGCSLRTSGLLKDGWRGRTESAASPMLSEIGPWGRAGGPGGRSGRSQGDSGVTNMLYVSGAVHGRYDLYCTMLYCEETDADMAPWSSVMGRVGLLPQHSPAWHHQYCMYCMYRMYCPQPAVCMPSRSSS